MTRRTLVLLIAIAASVSAALVSAMPARASRSHTIIPAQIDPTALKLPGTLLPTGAQVVHSAVSENADAQGTATPADGDASVFGLAHGGPTSYSSEGRLFGYRMDIHYAVNGTAVRTAYLASVYPTAAQAQAAYNDVTANDAAGGHIALIHIIGGKPLPGACTAGEKCDAEYFISPLDPTREAVTGVFVRGPVLVETASDAPAGQFSAIESAWQTDIYAILQAADQQVQAALSGNPATGSTSTATAVATGTSVPATVPPTAVPATATATATSQPLFVQATLGHKSIKAGQKQSVRVTTLAGAHVTIVVRFPKGKTLRHVGTASDSGTLAWTFKQPRSTTSGNNRTAQVNLTVSLGGETHKASKKYKIT